MAPISSRQMELVAVLAPSICPIVCIGSSLRKQAKLASSVPGSSGNSAGGRVAFSSRGKDGMVGGMENPKSSIPVVCGRSAQTALSDASVGMGERKRSSVSGWLGRDQSCHGSAVKPSAAEGGVASPAWLEAAVSSDMLA